LREIEVLFRDNVMESGKANKIIGGGQNIRTDMTRFGTSGGGARHRALSDGYARLNDLDEYYERERSVEESFHLSVKSKNFGRPSAVSY